MITLNLIPEQQKNILRNGRSFATFREVVMLIFLFASIIAMMLWLSRYYLELELSDIAQRNSANIMSNEYTSGRITKINTQINSTKIITNSYLPIRPTLENFANIVSENIALKLITYSRNQSTLQISGIAKNRANLLEFKNNLEQTQWITSVNLPMNDLIEKENNTFDITLSVDAAKMPKL